MSPRTPRTVRATRGGRRDQGPPDTRVQLPAFSPVKECPLSSYVPKVVVLVTAALGNQENPTWCNSVLCSDNMAT